MTTIVNPIVTMTSDLPEEMQYASRSAGLAVEQKRARGQGRRQRLPEVRTDIDAELMENAELYMCQRRDGLVEQYERQMQVLALLEAAQEDRMESDMSLQGSQQSNSEKAREECWMGLFPPDASGLPDSVREAGPSRWRQAAVAAQHQKPDQPMPSLSTGMEEALVEALYPLVMRQGEAHVRHMRHEFYSNYLAKDSAERSRAVGNELERWQLRVKCELLQELTRVSEESHNQVLSALNGILSFKDTDPGDQFSKTMNAAEAFHRQREDFYDSYIDQAGRDVQTYCVTGVQQLASLRRRMELACLKRWTDVERGLEDEVDIAWASCQTQMAKAALQLVQESLESVRLEVGELDIRPTMNQVDIITTAWRRCGTQVPGMLNFVEKLTQALPDQMGTCTVAKSALALFQKEFNRIIERVEKKKPALAAT